MQIESQAVSPSITTEVPPVSDVGPSAEILATSPGRHQVIRRNGKVTHFDGAKIGVAITKAFLAVEGGGAAASRRIHEIVEELTGQVTDNLFRRAGASGITVHIEDIQDQVELVLMRGGHHKVARAYVLYREKQSEKRAAEAAKKKPAPAAADVLHVTRVDGTRVPLDEVRMAAVVDEACRGLKQVEGARVLAEARRNLFDGVAEKDVGTALVMAARVQIEQEPNYSQVTARLLMDNLRREALSFLAGLPQEATQAEMGERYPEYFQA
ncbi:MAG TPA: ATP cone domain-containing protein, partial [Thioalkalivibrio sp.]|nr:ATP cone domain-containing protein [Thioalkalivibrio sp.]